MTKKLKRRRVNIKELLLSYILIALLIILVVHFNNFVIENSTAFGIAFLLFSANYFIIFFHERKYKKNFPYKPYKSKEKIMKRILIGMLAGLHYFLFIGSYNHKKYNTQVRYPETLECIFESISLAIILFVYLLISVIIFKIVGYYALLFMVTPMIITTIKYAHPLLPNNKRTDCQSADAKRFPMTPLTTPIIAAAQKIVFSFLVNL